MKTLELQLSQLKQRMSVSRKGRSTHIRQQIARVEELINNGPDTENRRPQPRFVKLFNTEEYNGVVARERNVSTRTTRRDAKRSAGG